MCVVRLLQWGVSIVLMRWCILCGAGSVGAGFEVAIGGR